MAPEHLSIEFGAAGDTLLGVVEEAQVFGEARTIRELVQDRGTGELALRAAVLCQQAQDGLLELG